MMAILNEQVMPLSEAAGFLPGGVNPSTLWRWRTKGVRGIKLQTVLVGGRRYVSRESLDRFLNAINAV